MRNTASVDSLSVAVPKVFKFLSTSSQLEENNNRYNCDDIYSDACECGYSEY